MRIKNNHKVKDQDIDGKQYASTRAILHDASVQLNRDSYSRKMHL
jgi:hypothetical protein